MKITFSTIKSGEIFCDDFLCLTDLNGTIEFKHMQTAGGIAVVYAPNGTGKSSLASLLDTEVTDESRKFVAADEYGNEIKPETGTFHVIHDQLNINVIRGKTTDYLIGAQIRREYELRDRLSVAYQNAFSQLSSKYKTDYKVSKVGDCILVHMQSLQDTVHQTAYPFIRSIVNSRQRGKDIDKDKFVEFIRDEANIPNLVELDADKRGFVINDLAKPKVIEKIISIHPYEILPDENTILIERHDDAIGILKKYHQLDSCVVCDSHISDGSELLESKKENRNNIYNNLDSKTKEILDKVVCDSSLNNEDPFEIKRIVSAFIADGEPTELIELQENLKRHIITIGDEMINILCHCFDDTNFFSDYDEHAQLTESQPELDSEELMFIENIISENIGKDITIIRDEENDRNYKLMIGDKALLGTDPKDMELSRGEQNFISLTFEFLLARHSDKEYVILDDPISSLDSVYKNKIAFCIIKFLENKKQLVLTHNTDLIRLLDVQLNNCFNLYIMNNILDGTNGFISVSEKEKKLLINLHDLVSFFQNKNNELVDNIHNRRHFLMAMVPFMRGYAHISLDSDDRYGQLSGIMHGYGTNNSLDVLSVYNSLFGNIFDGEEIISVSDILEVDYSALDILDKTQYPLLSDTLEQTLIYYHLRMKVEKELVDVFHLRTDDMMMLNQIIQKAFRCNENDPNFERMREYRVFFTSRKTLLNEFNHFEGNMNIFQPAIDISKESLKKEMEAIRNKLEEIRAFVSSQENA